MSHQPLENRTLTDEKLLVLVETWVDQIKILQDSRDKFQVTNNTVQDESDELNEIINKHNSIIHKFLRNLDDLMYHYRHRPVFDQLERLIATPPAVQDD